jgi:hypothetical protein
MGEICLTQRGVSAAAWSNIRARIEEAIKSDPKTFFGYVDLKKKRVGYPSVMHFESRFASSPVEICDLFAEFIYNEHIPMMPGCLMILAQNTCRMTQLFASVHFR